MISIKLSTVQYKWFHFLWSPIFSVLAHYEKMEKWAIVREGRICKKSTQFFFTYKDPLNKNIMND